MKKKLLTLLICFACVLASFSTGFSLFAAEDPGEENITFDLTSSHEEKGSIYFQDGTGTGYTVTIDPSATSLDNPILYDTVYKFKIVNSNSPYTFLGVKADDVTISINQNTPKIIKRSEITSTSIKITTSGYAGEEYWFLEVVDDKYNLTVNDEIISNYIYSTETVSGTFEAADGYTLPETITVTMNGEVVPTTSYTYDPDTGAFSIANITGDIEITAEAVEYPTVTINSNEEYTTTLPDHIIAGGNLSGTIFPDDEDLIMRKIEVEMVGNTSELVNYTFDRESGLFYLPGVTGDVTIDLTIGEPPTQAELLGDSIGGFISQLWDWLTDGAEAIVTSPILLVILVAIPIGSLVIYFIVRLIKRGSR